ncbi:hypothetical protein B0H10DRAFT_2192824 [Mycena sp. CBHHK59/15]|nr:hypothetical protein B0H10DRAFT_2192824 [Mycena sp. CBHHK59/15]
MSSLWLFFAILFFCIILCVDAFTFHSPAGFSLVRQILLAALPTFDLHDYQLDTCSVSSRRVLLLRRSNARHDIQILFRTLVSGIDGLYFPELELVLKTSDKTFIFAATISLVFRIKIYLDSIDPSHVDREFRVRTYHSINWPEENLETLELFKSDPRCQIIVATNGLAQGNDIAAVKTVIQVGEPESAEMFVQKPGCARPNAVKPRTIFYISAARTAKAVKVVSQTDTENAADAKKDGAVAMDRPVAQIISGCCKPSLQDELFDNPVSDPACACKTCLAFPPALQPAVCRCSDCLPEAATELFVPPAKVKKEPSDIPTSQRLTKLMKAAGTIRLQEFRLAIWFEGSDLMEGLTPLEEFLPDIMIQQLLDRFISFKTVADVTEIVKNVRGMSGHHAELHGVLTELATTFVQMKKDKAAEKAAEQFGVAFIRHIFPTRSVHHISSIHDELTVDDSH